MSFLVFLHLSLEDQTKFLRMKGMRHIPDEISAILVINEGLNLYVRQLVFFFFFFILKTNFKPSLYFSFCNLVVS